jgi:predicted HAD superfamily Cof-like phosphohydrolase
VAAVRPVREFHEAFGLPSYDQLFMPDAKRVALRLRLLREEMQEVEEELQRIQGKVNLHKYISAWDVYQDLALLAKELSDLRYVIEGSELEFGIPGDAVYAEVHRSNMSKLGPDGRPVRRHDGKVLKGPNYREADVLTAMGIIEGSTTP